MNKLESLIEEARNNPEGKEKLLKYISDEYILKSEAVSKSELLKTIEEHEFWIKRENDELHAIRVEMIRNLLIECNQVEK